MTHKSRSSVKLATAFIAVVIFLCTGCTNGPKSGGPSRVEQWAYSPVSLSIHPLSRLGVPAGREYPENLHIHVEFQDGDGFPCRAIGELVLTVSSSSTEDVRETIDLANAKTNRMRFDSMTRTYLVRFNRIPAGLTTVTVSATFDPDIGKTMRASCTINK